MVVVAGIACGLVMYGVAVTARHRAFTAADLAALAGAQVLLDGGDACGEAGRVAAVNGASLTTCGVAGEVVTVSTAVGVRLGRFGLGTAVGHARAGPVDLAADRGG